MYTTAPFYVYCTQAAPPNVLGEVGAQLIKYEPARCRLLRYQMRACSMQIAQIIKWKPLLTKAQTNYTTMEKELLPIVETLIGEAFERVPVYVTRSEAPCTY